MAVVSAAASATESDIFNNGQSFYGQPSRGTVGARGINLAIAGSLNVEYGETVTFRRGGQQFSWIFNGFDRMSVSITKIAPKEFSNSALVVYVGQDSLTRN